MSKREKAETECRECERCGKQLPTTKCVVCGKSVCGACSWDVADGDNVYTYCKDCDPNGDALDAQPETESAAGPWYRSEDKPPPKDGRTILAVYPDGIYVVRWLYGDDPSWSLYGTVFQTYDNPIAWAEIRPYQEEKP